MCAVSTLFTRRWRHCGRVQELREYMGSNYVHHIALRLVRIFPAINIMHYLAHGTLCAVCI